MYDNTSMAESKPTALENEKFDFDRASNMFEPFAYFLLNLKQRHQISSAFRESLRILKRWEPNSLYERKEVWLSKHIV